MTSIFGPETYNQFTDGGTNPPILPDGEGQLPFGENVKTSGPPSNIPPPLPRGRRELPGDGLKTSGPQDEGLPPVLPPGPPEYYYDPRFYQKEEKKWYQSDPKVQGPPKVDPPVILPPDVAAPKNPCIDLHQYGHVLWDYGFQWSSEIMSFAASPAVTRIAAFDDVSFATLVGVKNNEFTYSGKKFRVVCTGYYIRDFLCDVASVNYSNISSFNVSVAKFNIPKLGGDYYITGNGKLCRLEEVPTGTDKTPDLGDPNSKIPPYQPPIDVPSPPLGSGQVYGLIYADDIISDEQEIETKELWSHHTSSLQNHFRDVTSSLATVDYRIDVWNGRPDDVCASIQYKIFYGDYHGKGAVDYGGLDSETMTKAIYTQYAHVLLPHRQEKFVIDGNEEDYVYIIDVQRNLYETAMDTGNWELNLGYISSSITSGNSVSSSIVFGSWGSTGSYIDETVTGSRREVWLTSKTYDVVQGTLEDGVTSGGNTIGKFYPNHGVIVLGGSKMDSLYNFNTNRNVQKNGLNPLRLFTSISGSSAPNTYFDASGDNIGFRGRRLIIKHNKFVFIRVKNQLFNYTNNPTYVTGSEGEIREEFKNQEKVYITTIGLYNPQKELLAIAKLPQAYLKSCTEEALFTVKVSQ